MSFLSDFEGRIGSVFGAAPQGYTEPFSFKKLAKRAAREMENETYEVDGVYTAPALYTVLVSSSDDSIMRPLYAEITKETSTFVTQQAQKKNYVFVGKPLVRFMVDPSLKSGKFAVFAENVDSRTLVRLREEEHAFLGASSGVGGAAAQVRPVKAEPHMQSPAQPQVQSSVAPVSSVSPSPFAMPASVPFTDTDAGLEIMPSSFLDSNSAEAPAVVASVSDSAPMPVAVNAQNLIPNMQSVRQEEQPLPQKAPVHPVAAHATPAEAQSAARPKPASTATEAPSDLNLKKSAVATACLLIDRQSGRTFTGRAPRAIIGRERSMAQIVLRDPNVSRRHAELSFDGRNWHITDLDSTNGTLVNDINISECTLRDGDLLTIGLVNLEFRENIQ